MLICKMGYDHIEGGINCQDFSFQQDNYKMIVDGCSSSIHSEVGAKLFCNLFPRYNYDIKKIFSFLRVIFDSDRGLKDHLLFTINMLREYENFYEVAICGDGYIIKQTWDDKFEYEVIDYDNEPPYFAYNLLYDKNCLSKYKEGVAFKNFLYPKHQYKNVGVASDGIRYIVNGEHKEEFENLLRQGKELRMKLFINKNIKEFKDDISIVF